MATYDQMIYETALKEGFSPATAKLVVAQARFESNDYNSNVFKKNNNLYGMKWAGQPLATKGTPAPSKEGDFYAKYNSPADSTKDLVGRLYKITRNGVSFDDLKNVKTPEEWASLQKKRGYYGDKESTYAAGLKSKLNKIDILETIKNNEGKVVTGFLLLVLGIYLYLSNKK